VRVVAIACVKDGAVYSFGAGTYVGDEVPPPEVIGPFGQVILPNPKIELDSGEVVWGCECYWGPEKKMRERFFPEDAVVKEITPQQYRKRELP